ncbi:MAG: hypothetical protein ABSD68_04100 [Candidatus Micrarchaeales archaeon]
MNIQLMHMHSDRTQSEAIRGQAAMEYLMTYGWGILIIALGLTGLFSLGVFNTAKFSGNICRASAGFYCSPPEHLAGNGILTTLVGQSIGAMTLTGTGCSDSTNPPSTMKSQNLLMPAGAKMDLFFTCQLSSEAMGTPFAGTLWMSYMLGSQTVMESEIGAVQATVDMTGVTVGQGQPISQTTYSDISHSKTVSFPSPVIGGDMLVAVFSTTFTGSCTAPTISDTLGNSWVLETSKCNKGSAGNNYQYSSIWYANVVSGGADSIKATTSQNKGILAIYDLSPAPSTVVAASPGFGTTSSGTYTTGALSFPVNSALIGGLAESSGGGCCTSGPGFSAYGVGSGWGSEFSNTIVSPSSFPISSGGGGANGWAEVGAAFER